MASFKEILINSLSETLEIVAESRLVEALQELHDNNPTQYKTDIIGGYLLISSLSSAVLKSKTKIDDAIVKALKEAIEQSASDNNIELPE